MRKFLFLTICLLIPFGMSAQLQLHTKKYVISDFTGKTMKVVLTGNDMRDSYLRESVQKVWDISPYEFCNYKNFKKCCSSEDNYFLIVSDAQFNRESSPGIQMLSIFKGKSDASADNLSSLFEVVSIPFCSADNPDGRETDFLPLLINVLQDQILMSMEKEFNPTTEVRVRDKYQMKKWDKRCCISENDFAEKPGTSMKAILEKENIDIVSDEEIATLLEKRAHGTLVGYVVAPNRPINGSKCFCMLFDPCTMELYFIKSHKLGIRNPKGFSKAEIQAITSHKQ